MLSAKQSFSPSWLSDSGLARRTAPGHARDTPPGPPLPPPRPDRPEAPTSGPPGAVLVGAPPAGTKNLGARVRDIAGACAARHELSKSVEFLDFG